jgi:hypothetical protein
MEMITRVLHTSTRHPVRLNARSPEAHAALLDALGANRGLRELDLECSALVAAPGAPEPAVSLPNLRTLRVSQCVLSRCCPCCARGYCHSSEVMTVTFVESCSCVRNGTTGKHAASLGRACRRASTCCSTLSGVFRVCSWQHPRMRSKQKLRHAKTRRYLHVIGDWAGCGRCQRAAA